MPTPAQLLAAILHANTIELNAAAAPYNEVTVEDVENYAALGLVAGTDTAETLLKIISPVSTPVYENTGFATDDYSSPDFEYLVSPVDSITKTLPTTTGTTNAIAGTYTVYVKQKVVQGGDTWYVEKTLYFVVCIDLMRTPSLAATYECNASTPTFTVTDNTSQAGAGGFVYSSVARTITISPPYGSGLSPTTGSASPFTQSPLWTGTYGFSIEAFLTFVNGTDTIIVRYAGNDELLVICNNVTCKMFCCLEGIRQDYYAEANAAKKAILWSRLSLGLLEMEMYVRTSLCGGTQGSVFIDKFYEVTGCSTDCDCCDHQDAVQPVIPDCGCVSGEDGREIELRVNGTWLQWRYVGALGWTNLFNIADNTGPAGTDGVNGAALVWSDVETHTTTTNGAFETLSSFQTDHTSDAETLVSQGDILRIKAILTLNNAPSSDGIQAQIIINGTGLSNVVLNYAITAKSDDSIIILETDLALKDDTAGANTLRYASTIKVFGVNGGFGFRPLSREIMRTVADIGGATVDFAANDYVISLQGYSNDTADISSVMFVIEKLTTGAGGVLVGIKYSTPFTTTAGIQAYANVLGAAGKTMKRVYLDGTLLTSADWTYNSVTDTLTFVISITGASEVACDYA